MILYIYLFSLLLPYPTPEPNLVVKTKCIYASSLSETDVKTKQWIERHHFNCQGQLVTKELWVKGRIQRYRYVYNAQQLLGAMSLTTDQGELLQEWLYEYDGQGNKIAESYWLVNQYVVCTDFCYNEVQQLMTTKKYWDNQLASQLTTYTYQNRNLHTHTQHNRHQEVQKKVAYQYDEKNRLYITTSFDRHNNLVGKERRAYNSAHQVVSVLKMDAHEMPIYRRVNTYHKQVEQVAEVVYENVCHNWSRVYQKIFIYGNQGLLKEVKQYNQHSQLVQQWGYEYTFYE